MFQAVRLTAGQRLFSDLDLLAAEVRADPGPHLQVLRERGPAVWLTRLGVVAVVRYAEVRTVLEDEEGFIPRVSAARTEEPGPVPRSRNAQSASSPGRVQPSVRSGRDVPAPAEGLGAWVDAHAAALADRYVREGRFNGTALARSFITGAALRMLGLPETGPSPNRVSSSWMGALCQAGEHGQIRQDDVAHAAMGMDTTVHGICTALHALAERPEDWKDLRRGRIRGIDVFREALRLQPLAAGAVRRATRDTAIGGFPVRAGDRVWLSYFADRDPRRWDDNADLFVVPRAANADYLAFGVDERARATKARAEHLADRLLIALASRCTRLELGGDPARSMNTLGRPWRSLPLYATADRGRVRPSRAAATTGGRASPEARAPNLRRRTAP